MGLTNSQTLFSGADGPCGDTQMDSLSAAARWPARIELTFDRTAGRSVLRRRRHRGPLRVQKPFYPEGDVCHVYLLHPPGGMAGQDQLSMDVAVGSAADVLLTTPAFNKIYRTEALRSEVSQVLQVEEDCGLEWLPQGTILFGGSAYGQRTAIRAAGSSRFSYWDMICLGRPASGDGYEQGAGEQGLTVHIDDRPLYVDRFSWAADSPVRLSSWGLQGHSVFAQLLMYPADEDVLLRARQVLAQPSLLAVGLMNATLVDGLLVVRVLGDASFKVHGVLQAVWSALRPLVMGRSTCPPRIWAT